MKHETDNIGKPSKSSIHPSLPHLLCSVYYFWRVNVFGGVNDSKISQGSRRPNVRYRPSVLLKSYCHPLADCTRTAMAAIAQWFYELSNNKMTYSVVRDLRVCLKNRDITLSYLDIHPAGRNREPCVQTRISSADEH